MYIITPFKIERNEGRFFYGAIYDEDGKLQINYVRNDEKTAFKNKYAKLGGNVSSLNL